MKSKWLGWGIRAVSLAFPISVAALLVLLARYGWVSFIETEVTTFFAGTLFGLAVALAIVYATHIALSLQPSARPEGAQREHVGMVSLRRRLIWTNFLLLGAVIFLMTLLVLVGGIGFSLSGYLLIVSVVIVVIVAGHASWRRWRLLKPRQG